MTIPSLLFALLIALLLGTLFHLIRDGGAGHLFIYLAMSILGFIVGHLLGSWRGWVLFRVGPLNLGMEIIGAIAFLILADWLIRIPPRSPEEK